jgi:hypothetical protein
LRAKARHSHGMEGVQYREGGDVRRSSANGARWCRRPADGEALRGLATGGTDVMYMSR